MHGVDRGKSRTKQAKQPKKKKKERVLDKHPPTMKSENYLASLSTASSRVATKNTSLPLLLS